MKVTIVGGGCAGLGAAEVLLNGNIEVVLIEASNRIGGRAFTTTETQFAFDRGPQFVQDSNINEWKTIADRLRFTYISPDIATCYRVKRNNQWQDKAWDGKIDEVSSLLSSGFATAAELRNAAPLSGPLENDQFTQLALGADGYGAIAEAADPWRYVAKDSERQVDGGGPNLYVNAGIGALVTAYAEDLLIRYPQLLTIKLQSRIVEVRSDNNGVEVGIDGGEKVASAYAIVTVSTAALGMIAFVPPLPQAHSVANSYLPLGSYKKVAFRPKAMPPSIEVNTEYYIYDEDACWQYFRLPTFPDVLIGVAAGNFASQLDRMDDAHVVTRFLNAIRSGYPGEPIEPKDNEPVQVTNWSRQPFVWGAYSYTRFDGGAADDPTALNARLEIAKSVGRLHFAGEATYADAYGTIHGAYESGKRAALAILQNAGLN